MQEYQSLRETTRNENPLPSEAMVFDGKILENEIEGYRTLSVVGRELMGYEVQTTPVDGMDGVAYRSAKLPPRVISVRYKLVADSPEDFREKYNQMNQLLKTKEAVISFLDEPDYEFIGTLSGVDTVPEGALSVVSSFDIQCSDPYKYRVVESVTGTGSVEVTQSLAEPVVPYEIVVNNSSPVERYIIENGDLRIGLKDTSESTAPITIRPKTQDIIRNNTKRPHFLEWTSDLENFEVNTGDIITVRPESSEITVRVRERLR